MDECTSGCVNYVCRGGLVGCELGNRSFSRSLAETLFAAASTLVFLAAANWYFGPTVSSKSGSFGRLLENIMYVLCEPYYAFLYSVASAFVTWDATRKLQSENRKYDRTLVAIMLNCPIFIEIPPQFREFYRADQKSNATNVKASKVEMPETETAVVAEPKHNIVVRSGVQISNVSHHEIEIAAHGGNTPTESGTSNTPAPPKSEDIVTDINKWNACELPPKVHPSEDPQGPSEDSQGGEPEKQKRLYMQLRPSPFSALQVHKRLLLLELRFVPEYAQVQFLRSRSTFQSVVTTIQGFGYMFDVAQRMAEELAVSPLEAILAFFNLLVILQLLVNIYACVHYQRPLLLRLNDDQFAQYHTRTEQAKDLQLQGKYPSLLSNQTVPGIQMKVRVSKVFFLIGVFTALLSLAAFEFAFITYASRYTHHTHHCLLCSLSAFIYCLLALSAIILISLPISKKFRELYSKPKMHLRARWFTSVVSISSVALAILATVKCWHLFETPNVSFLTWLVPHRVKS